MGKIAEKASDKFRRRDSYERFRDACASAFFNFVFSKGGIFLWLIMSFAPFYFLKIPANQMINYALYWFLLLFSIIGGLLFVRYRYFVEIPKGWTRKQTQEYHRMKTGLYKVPDVFSRRYWVVASSFIVIVSVATGLSNGNFLAGYPLVMLAIFVWIVIQCTKIQRKFMKDKGIDTSIRWNKLPLAFVLMGIFMVVIVGMINIIKLLGSFGFFGIISLPYGIWMGYWLWDKYLRYRDPVYNNAVKNMWSRWRVYNKGRSRVKVHFRL